MAKLKLINLLKSPIAKNLSILVSGTVIAQLVYVGFQVVLRRLYSPEDFGAFAVYMSVVGIAITIASLRYEQAIVLPKSDIDGYKLTKLSILISSVFVLFFAIILFFFGTHFMNLIGLSSNYSSWLVYLPITIFIFSTYQALNYFLIRLKKFSTSGSNKVVRRFVEGGLQTVVGYWGKGFGLVIGDIIGHIVIIFRTIRNIGKMKCWDAADNSLTISQLSNEYKKFPLSNALPSLMNAISRLLPIIMISRLFSAEVTAYFDFARGILIIPLSLIAVSLNQILVQQFVQKKNNKQSVKKDALGTFFILMLGALLFILIIKFFGIPIFSLVFGETWINSGVYAQILIWSFAIKFVVSPFNSSFIAFERIGIGSLWQTFYFILIVSLFFIDFENIESFLKLYVVVDVIAFAVAGIINFSILHQYEKRLKQKNLNS
ncbi:MAG: oligosaccharide flippase family protein [Salinivirgaceae bacterium]|nr:oligosaccharide flippase family protein [Salinivirgaceae bacterium]